MKLEEGNGRQVRLLMYFGGHRIWQESGTVLWLNGEAHSEGIERGM